MKARPTCRRTLRAPAAASSQTTSASNIVWKKRTVASRSDAKRCAWSRLMRIPVDYRDEIQRDGQPVKDPISKIMSKTVPRFLSGASVEKVESKMTRLKLHAVPVVDAKGAIFGIVSS